MNKIDFLDYAINVFFFLYLYEDSNQKGILFFEEAIF